MTTTITKTFDVTRVKHHAEREGILKLMLDLRAAEKRRDEAEDALDAARDEEYTKRHDALVEAHSAKRQALLKEFKAQVQALDDEYAARAGLPLGLQAEVDRLEEAYSAAPGPGNFLEDDDGNIVRCALSGLPVFDGEDVLAPDWDDKSVVILKALVDPEEPEAAAKEAA